MYHTTIIRRLKYDFSASLTHLGIFNNNENVMIDVAICKKWWRHECKLMCTKKRDFGHF